jgi:DNA-binding transcriptional ArsR family regulator
MRLDEEILALRNDLNRFRTEIRQRLEVIENEVNKQVSLNYNKTIIDYVSGMSQDLVANLKCEVPDEERYCKSQMAGLQSEYISLMKSGQISESLSALNGAIQKLGMLKRSFEEKGRMGCVRCMENETLLLESNRKLLDQLKLLETPAVTIVQNKATIGALDAETATDSILNPISHKVRIKILQCIYEGENRFTDLAKATGLDGGQLLYHIKILKEAGFLDQFESKDYVLSAKGMKALVMLAQLSHELY